jgi:Transposase
VGLVAKLVWRVKLVAELRPGVLTETEVARIERDEQAGLADLGLQLAETKRLTAALQAEIVPAQVAAVGEQRRCCSSCGRRLASKGYYPVTFRSLFGDVPVRVRQLLVCSCQKAVEVKSFGVLGLGHDAVAPELAYVTARYAALAPFGKVAVLLSELLPISGAPHVGTIRNRTRRVGENVVREHATEIAKQIAAPSAGAAVVGLDGGYVRSRHRQEERHFEVIAGKVIDAAGSQHRFAFARNGQTASAKAFAQALAAAGVRAETPATVLCDGDAGLWRLQREALPAATVVLDWWHVAVRFEHALQTARGLGSGAAGADLADAATDNLERAKWRLWHGRWTGCRRKLAGLYRWTKRKPLRELAGINRLQRHIYELLGYLERNEDMLVHYAARRRQGKPISTAFVESAVNEIVAKRMNKKQQMRWNRTTVQPFLDVRTAVLNETLEDAFRHRYPGFRSANDDQVRPVAA